MRGAVLQRIEHDAQFRCVLYQAPPPADSAADALAASARGPASTSASATETGAGGGASDPPTPSAAAQASGLEGGKSADTASATKSAAPVHKVLVGTEHNTIMSFVLDSKVWV